MEELSEKEQEDALPLLLDEGLDIGEPSRPRLALHLKTSSSIASPMRPLPLSQQGGLFYGEIKRNVSRQPIRSRQQNVSMARYISTESLSGNELVHLWDKIQLTPDEGLVLQALHFIDERIEQIRVMGAGQYFGGRGGFIIKRRGENSPFPLGSLGDGAWRMLALAIVMTQCANGVLFIDEIDTGLHYTVMSDMWRFIASASKQFNTQVFATTHSYDCVHSLSAICQADAGANSYVTIQRIESDKDTAIPFTEAEVKIAAERQIEVR